MDFSLQSQPPPSSEEGLGLQSVSFNTTSMNTSFPTLLLRYSLTAAILAAIALPTALSQQSNPYLALTTASNLTVYDTISGVNLSVLKSSPLAQHGNVTITLISTGGAGLPHVYQLAYVPDPGFVGMDTFAIEMTYINVWPYLHYQAYQVAVYPTLLTAQGDFAVSNGGSSVTIPVLSNDVSSAGPLTITEIPLTVNGTATIAGGEQIIFTPNPGYIGTAHLNYVVCDGQNNCKTAQVNIGVNNGNPPEEDTLQVATVKGTPLSIPLTYNGYTLFQAPANGTVSLQNGMAFRYMPNPGFTGADQFVLSKVVNGVEIPKIVQVAVLNVPGQNRMAMNDVVYTPKGQAITFNVRSNDIGALQVKSWSVPGSLPGTISGTNAAGNVTFTPNPTYTGVATFSYKIGNAFVPDLEMATVSVVIGNLGPTQADYDLTTPKSTPMVINYRVPFSGFNFIVTKSPAHGSCTVYPGYTTQTIQGESISGYNLLVYTPNAAYTGADEFDVNYNVGAAGQNVKVRVNVVEVSSASGPYCVGDCVWAGDANNDGIVNNKDLLPLGYFMGLEGNARSNNGQEWYGQAAANWNDPFTANPTDLKFVDGDGDGLISSDDTVSIGLFYGQTHQLLPKVPALSKGLPFQLKMTPANPGEGDLVTIEVSLGTLAKPVANLYGFTFDLSLSPEIVDSAFHMVYYNNTWLNRNSPSIWLSKNPAAHRLESAFTRTNGIASSGHGKIGQCDFIITDIVDIAKPGKAGNVSARATLDSPSMMWADGSITSAESITLDIPLRLKKPSDVTTVTEQDLLAYPSPASGLLQIHLNGTDIMQSISLFDALGRIVWQCDAPQPEHHVADVSNLPSGMYILEVRTSTGLVAKKIVIADR